MSSCCQIRRGKYLQLWFKSSERKQYSIAKQTLSFGKIAKIYLHKKFQFNVFKIVAETGISKVAVLLCLCHSMPPKVLSELIFYWTAAILEILKHQKFEISWLQLPKKEGYHPIQNGMLSSCQKSMLEKRQIFLNFAVNFQEEDDISLQNKM